MKDDNQVQDKDESAPAPERAQGAGAVNTSRRRFTRAGLTASAVMTLASRPAMGTYYCSYSGHMSGNLSRPGGAVTCHGMHSGYWKHNPYNWTSTHCEPGKPNPTTYQGDQCMDYKHITWGELKQKWWQLPKDRRESYKSWANFTSSTPNDAYPNPNIPPTKLGELLSGCGLSLSDPHKTMMQCYWDPPGPGEPEGLLCECSTAFLNIEYFGAESYGYTKDELKHFISSWSGGYSELRDALHYLNNRG